jgi:hypothetical protein
MSNIPPGLFSPFTTYGRYNQLQFLIEQLILKIQTATLVKVISCTNSGGLSPIGTVNVQPQVNQVDAAGNSTPHTTISNVPYLRMQSAAGSGIILDPAPGDIGFCLFASRDISKVVSTQAQANPGSDRYYSFSDAMYIGLGLSQSAPTQYIQFSPAGINIVSPAAITIQAPIINLQGQVNQTDGTIVAETDVLAGPNSISLVTHIHDYGTPPQPTTPPIP